MGWTHFFIMSWRQGHCRVNPRKLILDFFLSSAQKSLVASVGLNLYSKKLRTSVIVNHMIQYQKIRSDKRRKLCGIYTWLWALWCSLPGDPGRPWFFFYLKVSLHYNIVSSGMKRSLFHGHSSYVLLYCWERVQYNTSYSSKWAVGLLVCQNSISAWAQSRQQLRMQKKKKKVGLVLWVITKTWKEEWCGRGSDLWSTSSA